MRRNSFLSKFISACFLIFLFGININIAFCVEDTPSTNKVNETFTISNIEYKITEAVKTDNIGLVSAVRFYDRSAVLNRKVKSYVSGSSYVYFVTAIEPVSNSVDVEHLYLEGFKEDSTNSLDVQNMSNLKTVYVDKSSYVAAAQNKFPDADVYKKPDISTNEPVKNLSCALEESNIIKLTWDKVENADNYVIARIDKSSGDVIEAITTDCEYVDSGVESGKTYDYAVTAFLGSGEKNDTFTVQLGSSEIKEISVPNQAGSDINTNLGNNNTIISGPNHVTNKNNSLDLNESEISTSQENNNNLESSETNMSNSNDNVYKTGDARNHMVLFFCVMYFVGFYVFLCAIEYKRN